MPCVLPAAPEDQSLLEPRHRRVGVPFPGNRRRVAALPRLLSVRMLTGRGGARPDGSGATATKEPSSSQSRPAGRVCISRRWHHRFPPHEQSSSTPHDQTPRLRGLGQLLQGADAALAARASLRAGAGRHLRRRIADRRSTSPGTRPGGRRCSRSTAARSPSRARSCSTSQRARRSCRTTASSGPTCTRGCSSSRTCSSRTSARRASGG